MELIQQHKKYIYLGCAALALIFLAFCPSVDILGKSTYNGFEFVFKAKGAGFSRFLMLLAILTPIAAGVFALIKKETEVDKLMLTCFGASFALGLITLIAMPTGASFAFGGYFYLLLTAAGAAVAFLSNQQPK